MMIKYLLPNLTSNMVFGVGCSWRGVVDFLLCFVAAGRWTCQPACFNLITNGMGGITSVFLCCFGNCLGCCKCVCQNTSWIHAWAQIPTFHSDSQRFKTLPSRHTLGKLKYFYEFSVDDFMSIAIASSKQQLDHIATTLLHGVHDVFPPCKNDSEDSILLKKLKTCDGAWALHKDLLSIILDGNVGPKNIWLEEVKREMLLSTLHKWIWMYGCISKSIPFLEFYSIIYKIQHAFIVTLNGQRPYNIIYMQLNWLIGSTLAGINPLLTRCMISKPFFVNQPVIPCFAKS